MIEAAIVANAKSKTIVLYFCPECRRQTYGAETSKPKHTHNLNNSANNAERR